MSKGNNKFEELFENLDEAIEKASEPLDAIDEAFNNLIDELELKENKTDEEKELLEYLRREYLRITVTDHLWHLSNHAKFNLGLL
ncbi:hypothetical protein [uncultured Clostridium sp.]|uniref:hypothetical protein n=1 Tax=uncultured Clostridium sp. TaxID=59620 RepID=UPI0025E6F725|nr:hypothetical protein [uncultured Clostridium sp.]